MKKVIMMLVGMFMLSCSLMAQETMPRRQKKVTYEQMTEKMVKELQLDEKQQKKVAKITLWTEEIYLDKNFSLSTMNLRCIPSPSKVSPE